MNTLTDIKNQFDALPQYQIEVGVISLQSGRKVSSKVKLGITNAELMYIHENGSPLRHLPARPVLDLTLKWVNSSGLVNDTLDKCFEVFLKTANPQDVENELNKMCLKIQNYARNIIYSNDGRLAPNAQSTINAKGFDHPLFVTGQLARSITCRVVKL